MGLDDISFTNFACGISPPEVIDELNSLAATTTSASSTTSPQPFASDLIDCNFDNRDTCGWRNDYTSDFKWILNRGSTSFFDTGPSTGKLFYTFFKVFQKFTRF
jgi:hypothetical protein